LRQAGEASHTKLHLFLILLLVLLVRLPDLPFHWVNWDEGAMMSQAYAMTRGDELYRDIFQIHPLLNIAIFIPFFATLKAEWVPHAVKLFNLLLVAAGGFLMVGMCRRWIGHQTVALVGAAMFVFTLGRRWALSSFGAFYNIFPILLSVDLLFLRGRPTRKTYALCGLLWGVAIFMKQVAVFDILVLVACLIVLQRKRPVEFLAAAAWLSAGFVAVAAPVALYFCWRGTFIEALQASFLRPVTGYAQAWPAGHGAPALLAGRREILHEALLKIYATFPLPLFAIVCGVWRGLLEMAGKAGLLTAAPEQEEDRRARTFFWIVLLWCGADLLGILFIGRFYIHYLLPLVPGICLASVYWMAGLEEKSRRSLAAAILLVLFGIGAFQLARSVKEDGWMPYKVRRSRAVASYVASHTRSTDRIFLYLYGGTDVFYLAGRLSNNGIYEYVDMCDDHIKDARASQESRDRFLKTPPAMILVDPRVGLAGCEVTKSFVQGILDERYERVAAVEGVDLYAPRASDSTADSSNPPSSRF